jgi:hypothetical protein
MKSRKPHPVILNGESRRLYLQSISDRRVKKALTKKNFNQTFKTTERILTADEQLKETMDYQFPDNLSNDIAKKATENGKSPDNRK